MGSFIDIQNADLVKSTRNTYSMCYTADKGSVYNLQNTAFEESGSTYD